MLILLTALKEYPLNRCNGLKVRYVICAVAADIVSIKIVEPIAIVMFSILLCAFITPCKWYKRF